MGKVADGDEIGKGQDRKESEAPRHRHDPDDSGDEHTCRDAAHDVVHRVRRHDVMRHGQETLRNFRRRKDRAGHEKRRNGCTDDIGAEDDAPQASGVSENFPAGTRKTGMTVVIVFSVKSCNRPRMTIKNPVV